MFHCHEDQRIISPRHVIQPSHIQLHINNAIDFQMEKLYWTHLARDLVHLRSVPLQGAGVAVGYEAPPPWVPHQPRPHPALQGVLGVCPAQPAHRPLHVVV